MHGMAAALPVVTMINTPELAPDSLAAAAPVSTDQLAEVTGGGGLGDILKAFGPKAAKYGTVADGVLGLFGAGGSGGLTNLFKSASGTSGTTSSSSGSLMNLFKSFGGTGGTSPNGTSAIASSAPETNQSE
jgi:hypothetical protein